MTTPTREPEIAIGTHRLHTSGQEYGCRGCRMRMPRAWFEQNPSCAPAREPKADVEAARRIAHDLHEYGFGGDQDPQTLINMAALEKHVLAALATARVQGEASERERWISVVELWENCDYSTSARYAVSRILAALREAPK